MKNYLNRQWIFSSGLYILSLVARTNLLNYLTSFFTWIFAKLNLLIINPGKSDNPSSKELAYKWKKLMPIDNQENYRVMELDDKTTYTEIHIKCPLRGSNDVEACNKLMNYDRTLMDSLGGNLVVLESQSNSGKEFCKLAIRKKGVPTEDLIPAHLNKSKKH